MIYLKLFWAFFQIGLFSIGGGYAALPLMQHQIIDLHRWMTLDEFADIITIAEMTPGPIAINSATFIGAKLCGIPGSLLATFGCVLPSFIIVMLLAILYKKYKELKVVDGLLRGLRPAAVGMIAAAGATIVVLTVWNGKGIGLDIDFISVGLIAAALFVLRAFKVSPIFVMIGAGTIGGLIYYFV